MAAAAPKSPRSPGRGRAAGSALALLAAALLAAPAPAETTPEERADVLYERGARALRQGDVDTALTHLEASAALAPERPDALALLGRALLVAGRPDEAADVLERLERIDPDAPQLDYLLGLARFRGERFGAARDRLLAARAERPGDGLLLLLLGIAHQELGENDAAERAFARAVALDPTLEGQVAFRRGIGALRERRLGEARDRFEQVEARLPRSTLAGSAARYVERIERHRRPVDVHATIGVGFDSNVNLTDDDDAFLLSDDDDAYAVTELGLSLLVVDRERLRVRVGQTLTADFHEDLDDFDLEISRTWGAASLRLAEWMRADLRYTFEYVHADWDAFRRTHALEPGLRVRLYQGLVTNLFYRFEDRSYFDDLDGPARVFDRDGHVQRIGLDQYWYFREAQPWGQSFVRVGYRYRHESAEGERFDSAGHEPVVTLGLTLPLRLLLTVDGRLEWRDFDEPGQTGDTSDRRDRIRRLRVGLRRALGEYLTLDFGYRYTRRSSNADAFDYRRHVGELLATIRY